MYIYKVIYINLNIILKLCFFIIQLLISLSIYSCHSYNNKKAPISDIGNQTKLNISSNVNYLYRHIKNTNHYYIEKYKYTVKKGDNLYYISSIFGMKYLDIAQYNNIMSPYKLKIGQILYFNKKINININHDNTNNNLILKKAKRFKSRVIINKKFLNYPQKNKNYHWFWPTSGKIIDSFSDTKNGNKGIDIAGSYKQPVFATASGMVVYVGNSIQGYGNLIIIKHNNDYLSAYAHNDKVLVNEKQNVQAQQKIAIMGITKFNSVRLHFEIRYKGKSVDPLHYLPPR